MINKTNKQNSNLVIYISLIFLLILNIVTFLNTQKPAKPTSTIINTSSENKGTVIGVVDIKRIQTTAKITASVNKQRDKYIKDLKDKSEELKANLKKKEDTIKAQAKTLSQKVLQEKVIDLQKEIRESEMELANEAKKIQISYAQAVQKIQMQYLNPILEEVAKESNFDILTTNQDSVIINKSLDVTSEVIKRLDKKETSLKMKKPSEMK